MMTIFIQASVKIKEKFRHVKIVETCSASCLINPYLLLMSDVGGQRLCRRCKSFYKRSNWAHNSFVESCRSRL